MPQAYSYNIGFNFQNIQILVNLMSSILSDSKHLLLDVGLKKKNF